LLDITLKIIENGRFMGGKSLLVSQERERVIKLLYMRWINFR